MSNAVSAPPMASCSLLQENSSLPWCIHTANHLSNSALDSTVPSPVLRLHPQKERRLTVSDWAVAQELIDGGDGRESDVPCHWLYSENEDVHVSGEWFRWNGCVVVALVHPGAPDLPSVRTQTKMATATLLRAKAHLGSPWKDAPALSDTDFVRFCNSWFPTSATNRASTKASTPTARDSKVPAQCNAEEHFVVLASLLVVPFGVLMYPALWVLILPGFAVAKLYLGGFWSEAPSTSDADATQRCNSRVPDADANEPVRSAGDLKVPEHYNAEDYFAMLVSILVVPIGVLMYPALWVLTLPNFVAMDLYLAPFEKPLKMIPRTNRFYAFSAFQFVLALPALLLIAVYWIYLLLVILPSSLLFSVASGRIANVSTNWTLLKDMRQSTGFTWNGILVSLMGAMHRQGLCEFLFFFPSIVVAVPVLKYLFTCNPLIHNLSTKHANQWTVPLGLTDDQAVASALQSMRWTAHDEKDRADIDSHEFSAHYPLIPDGESPPTSVVGVQFTTVIVNFTKTTRNISSTGLRSQLGKRGIYVVELFFWNPCHMVTGYVEVNVQHEGSIEHPMWCFTGDNYWGNRFYKNIDNLFWRYAPQCGGYFQTHGDVDIDISR